MHFPEHLREAGDGSPAPEDEDDIHESPIGGEALLTTIKHLLRGLHLTKGFTSQVCMPSKIKLYIDHSHYEHMFSF